MRKLKKALALTLTLALSLAMAVPALAAPKSIRFMELSVDLSDVTSEETVTLNSYDSERFLTVPVGCKIESIGELTIWKASQNADGSYTYDASTGESEGNEIVLDADRAGSVWFVQAVAISYINFLVKVEGASTPVQPEQPTEPTTPTEPPAPEQPTAPVEPVTKTAEPTNDDLYVDGTLAVPAAYKIGGSNYFKIRDVAALLDGTDAQFSVDYDNDTRIVYLVTGQSYEKKSSDLAGVSAGEKPAISTNDSTYVNGEKVELTVYKIGGSNYFKLRDLGKALGFNVGYTDGYGAFIETDKAYEG